jgi:hypothetical protein
MSLLLTNSMPVENRDTDTPEHPNFVTTLNQHQQFHIHQSNAAQD